MWYTGMQNLLPSCNYHHSGGVSGVFMGSVAVVHPADGGQRYSVLGLSVHDMHVFVRTQAEAFSHCLAIDRVNSSSCARFSLCLCHFVCIIS